MTIDTKRLRDLIQRASPLPWLLASSNSWRRIVDSTHTWVCAPCTQPDGHPDLQFVGGFEGANAKLLIEAVNVMPELLNTIDVQAAMVGALRANAEFGIKERDFLVAENSRLRVSLEELLGYQSLAPKSVVDAARATLAQEQS